MSVEQRVDWHERMAARTRVDVGSGLASILALSGATDLISFSGGFPDPATFPGEVVAGLLRELVDAGDATAMQYAPTQGLAGPRAYLRERLEAREGRRPEEPELMITSGGIEGLELLAKSFLDPGDTVLVEGPTYLGAIMAFRGFEAEVLAVPMDGDGLDVERLEGILASGPPPKLLYTIPDHQNPTGQSLSAERRAALAEVARRHGLLVVEDVAYRELGFDGAPPPPSLWSLAPDVVVQLGTFSKTFFPGVRLGWAAGPAEVVAQMVMAKQNTDQCAGAMGQRLLEEYGRRGHLDAQIARSRALYGRRCRLLLAALERHLPAGATWTAPAGGFFSWVSLPPSLDTTPLAAEAVARRVAYVPGSPFFPDGAGQNTLRLAFSKVADEDIDEGVARLAAVLAGAMAGAAR